MWHMFCREIGMQSRKSKGVITFQFTFFTPFRYIKAMSGVCWCSEQAFCWQAPQQQPGLLFAGKGWSWLFQELFVTIQDENASHSPCYHLCYLFLDQLPDKGWPWAMPWLLTAASTVHKVQKSLGTSEVLSSRSQGSINEEINQVTQGTEMLVCTVSVPNQNKTWKNNLKDVTAFIEEIIRESLIRIRKPALSFVAL